VKRIIITFIFVLLSGNVFADTALKKILDLYSSKINDLDRSQHLFYSTELAVATEKIREVGLPCYRYVLNDKKNYDTALECINFRILLGNDADEWQEYLSKLLIITKTNFQLLDNKDWVVSWNTERFEQYSTNVEKTVSNFVIMSELFELVSSD
jgi:hypothetical protein